VNPGVTVLETFTGNWDDVAAAKEAAVAQLRRGADILIHNVDAGSFGVFQAVRESTTAEAPRYAMGMNRDQNDVAPDVILGSAVIRIPEAFLTVARRVLAGDLPAEPFYVGEAQDVIDFVPNPGLEELIPTDLLARVAAARDSIRSGELVVPRVPFVEGEEGVEVPGGTGEGVTASVELRELRKQFGPVVALAGASLTAFPGEVHALLGENGAGKTTLLNLLDGMLAPDSGEIRIQGSNASPRSPREAVALGVGLVHQHFTLVPRFTVLENVALGLGSRGWGLGWPMSDVRERLLALAEETGLGVDPDAPVEGLEVSARQRVEILKVLLSRSRDPGSGRAHGRAGSPGRWSASSGSSGVWRPGGARSSWSPTSWTRCSRWRIG
jgi:ABC-type ATPase involved in cell division